MLLQDKKALSPVISGIILISVTIAVAIAATSFMGSLSINFMKTEQIAVADCMWAPDNSYAQLTVTNSGTDPVQISTIKVDGTPAADFSFSSGSSTLQAGTSAVITVSDFFAANAKHQFSVITTKGQPFPYIATAPPSSVSFQMEWGFATVSDEFITIPLENNYRTPVIVCVPQYDSGIPRTVRLTEITGSSFKARVQNPSGTVCPDTFVHYLVAEEGVWDYPIKIEARKYTTDTVGENNNWDYDTRTYGQQYAGNIVVLHQVMTNNDPTWITTYVSKENSRSSPPSSIDTSFRIALNGAEALNSHDSETIGYIILEEDYGDVASVKFDVKQTTDSIQGLTNSPPYSTTFSQTFDSVPQVLVSTLLEMDGGNGGWVVNYSVTQTHASLACDEDQVADSERNHTGEICGFIAFQAEGSYPN